MDVFLFYLVLFVSMPCGLFILLATPKENRFESKLQKYFAGFFILSGLSWPILFYSREFDSLTLNFFGHFINHVAFFMLLKGFLERAKKASIRNNSVLLIAILFAFAQAFVFNGLMKNYGVASTIGHVLYVAILSISVNNISNKTIKTVGEKATVLAIFCGLMVATVTIIDGWMLNQQTSTIMLTGQILFYISMFGGLMSLLLSDEVEKHRINSITDHMTGLYNRRFFIEKTEQMITKNGYGYRPLSVIVCDIDNFKDVNDNYGHDVGDRVIIEFANVLQKIIREGDLLARIGGEEFIILLPNTNIQTASVVAERMREETQNLVLHSDDRNINITASFGVTDFANGDINDNIKRADNALYEAKRSGRNRVSVILV